VDRVNKKKTMILLDLSRAALLCVLPLADTLWAIYAMTFILHAASHVFGNASGVYITKLIPEDQRPRFNSLNSLPGSVAFLAGPAIAGLLFMVGTPDFAILMNAAALPASGLLTILMPDVEREPLHEKSPAELFQNHVPADIMGRVVSFNGFIESVPVIVMTFLFDVAADIYAIRPVIVLGTAMMLLLGMVIAFPCLNSRGISMLDKQRIKTYY
jgi:Major Facilitator Superfamily.